jgi:transposase
MIAGLESPSGEAKKKTIVMDAGIATEANLALLRQKGYEYVCLSRRRLKEYPESVRDGQGQAVRRTARGNQQVQLSVFHPEGAPDTWMYVQSPAKRTKEERVYFIRTSYENSSEGELWDIYNTIREVESTFCCLKTDLQLRPVYHQRDERIEAHLYT